MFNKRKQKRGQSLVEFVLCIPILLMLLAGTADFGYVMWVDMTITEAARSGAIFATSIANSIEKWNKNNGNADIVKNYILAVSAGTGLKPEEISITPVTVGTVEGLKIEINHIHHYLAPISFVGIRAEATANTYPMNRSFTCGFLKNNVP